MTKGLCIKCAKELGVPVDHIAGNMLDQLGLSPEQLQHPMETLVFHPVSGLRLIPYRSVGNAGGFLLAKRFAEVTIGDRKQSARVAFAAEGLGKGACYQALTGG